MTPRAGRRRWCLALALRAFPKRWRAVNGEEFLATAEALDTDGRSLRFGLELAQTVRAGYALRLRTRPPLGLLIGYYYLGNPPPEQWHSWMRDELSSPILGVRRMLYILWPVYAVFLWSRPWSDESGWVANSWIVVAIFYILQLTVGAPFMNRRMRRQAYKRAGWADNETLSDEAL